MNRIVDNEARIRQIVEESLPKYILGLDNVHYHVLFGGLPGGPGGSLLIAVWIGIFIKNPLLGQPPIANFVAVHNPLADKKEIEDLLLSGCQALRETKAKVMSVNNGKEHT